MNNIRLYNEQNEFIRWIDEDERKRLEVLNAIDDVHEVRGKKPKWIGVKLRGFEPSLFYSKTSISLADIRANVGELKDFSPGRVRAAQTKINVWPHVGDTKAINIRAGRTVFRPVEV